MQWTKAEGHTYEEALNLILSWGYTKPELDEFLAYNPGDLYRVPEAFGGARESAQTGITYAAPGSGGQAATPSTSGDPALLTGTGSGAPVSILTNVAPPAVNVAPPAVSVMGGSTTIAGFSIPSWVWLVAAAGAVYYFVIRKR